MKTLSSLSIAIFATTYMVSVGANAADTGIDGIQTTELASHVGGEQTAAPAPQTPEEKVAADKAAQEKAAQEKAEQKIQPKQSIVKEALKARVNQFAASYKARKSLGKLRPADIKLHDWFSAKQKTFPDNQITLTEENRREMALQFDLYDEAVGAPVSGDDGMLEALRAKEEELAAAQARAEAAEKQANENAAAFQKCTTDCADAKSQVEKLRQEAAAAKAAAEDNARRLADAQDQLGRGRRSSYDRDDRDGDGDFDRDGRRHSTSGRMSGRTPSEVLGNLFGNNVSPYNLYGNNPFNSPLYNPLSMQNPLLFGQNGMQNPYNNWLQQQQLAQAMLGNQYGYNPYGLNNGRMLPNMYMAPGGAFNSYPQSPWGFNPNNRGPLPTMYPAPGGGFGGGFAGSPFGGVGPGTMWNNGGWNVRPVGGFGGGYGGGAPAVLPYGGVGGGIGGGAIGFGGIGGGYGGTAPAIMPYNGVGSGIGYSTGYSQYGLGGNYSYGYQYGGRQLPTYYRLY